MVWGFEHDTCGMEGDRAGRRLACNSRSKRIRSNSPYHSVELLLSDII
jgi:hypothetical protein